MTKSSKNKGPTTTARKNAAVMARIVGGVAEDCGLRCMVNTYTSKKLAKIEGAVECRGSTVTVSLVDISAHDAGVMLLALEYSRGGWKNRKWTEALNRLFEEIEEGESR
jgi:hypothetical protein